MNRHLVAGLGLSALLVASCGSPPELDVVSWAKGCYSLWDGDTWLAPSLTGDSYSFSAREPAGAARFFMQPSDLGTYLFYDENAHHLVAKDNATTRETRLESDVTLVDDDYI